MSRNTVVVAYEVWRNDRLVRAYPVEANSPYSVSVHAVAQAAATACLNPGDTVTIKLITKERI